MATVLDFTNSKDPRNNEELVGGAKNFALLNGMSMRTSEAPDSSDAVNPAPMTLFPSVVPRHCLDEVKSLQTKFNSLMHNVAHDHEFLENCLKHVIKVDDFTRKLWEIYCKVQDLRKNNTQICLGLFRNDFMMDVGENQSNKTPQDLARSVRLKQVEFNTIASSFGGLVTQLTDVHRYNISRTGYNEKEKLFSHLPENSPSKALARGLIKAWEIYRKEYKPNHIPAILFIVGKPEKNTLDQVWIEKQIFQQNTQIPVIYRSFSDLRNAEKPASVDFPLVVDGVEVAVVYFRDGYAPNHYKNEEDWNVRSWMERSLAINCPTCSYQLAGTKKIQQVLAGKGVLEKFIQDAGDVRRMRALFAGQFSLDKGEEEGKAISMALQNPGGYVLKPQREGGGNNLYDEELKETLMKIKDTEERSAYILMEKIHTWVQRNHLIKVGEHSGLRDVLSEIGVYGVYIGKGNEDPIVNEESGHLMRTKASGINEGGVATGFATLDTPFLIDT